MVHFQSMFVGSIFSITSFLIVHQQLSYREQLSKKWKLRSTYCWHLLLLLLIFLYCLYWCLSSLCFLFLKIIVHCFFIFCWSFIFFVYYHSWLLVFFCGFNLTHVFFSFRLFFPSYIYIYIVFLEGQINEALDSFKKQSNYTSSQQQVKMNEYLFMLVAFPFNLFSHYDSFFFNVSWIYMDWNFDDALKSIWSCHSKKTKQQTHETSKNFRSGYYQLLPILRNHGIKVLVTLRMPYQERMMSNGENIALTCHEFAFY